MRALLFAFVFFALPHSDWVHRKLQVSRDAIPLGVMNIALIVAVVLWLAGKLNPPSHRNPFRSYSVFVAVVLLGAVGALAFGYSGPMETLTTTKREVSLLWLYFVPLASLKNKRHFALVFALGLFIQLVIGYETFASGVLGGSAFHDGKRGSGPFDVLWMGADVAAAYLAQMLMFPLAIALFEESGWLQRLVALGAAGIGFLGILATYSRGSLVAVVAGLAVMTLVRISSIKKMLAALAIVGMGILLLPQSMMTRFEETTNEEGTLDESSTTRLLYSRTAWTIFRDHPLGVGTGQVRYAMSAYLPGFLDAKTLAKGGAYGKAFNLFVDPHNGFLYTLLEYGPLGLAVFVWLLGAVFWSAFRICRDPHASQVHRVYSLGMVGFVTSLALCNMFYANFYKELVLGTLALHFGMMAAVRAQYDEELAADLAEEDEDPEAGDADHTAQELPGPMISV